MYEMEAIQTLITKLDQLSKEVEQLHLNQILTYRVSCGVCGLIGHHSSECQQVNWDASISRMNEFNSHVSGNLYFDPYLSDDVYPQQLIENQNCSYNFSPPITDYSFYAPVQEMQVVPENSRMEELLEQWLLSQQKGASHWNDEEPPKQFEADLDEGVHSTNLRNGEQLETHEPEGQRSEQYLIETPASNFPTYTDSSFMDIVYDRFMELERSETEELPRQFEANPIEGADEIILQSGEQLKVYEPEQEEKKENQSETLAPEVSNVSKFLTDTDSYFMNDVVARSMESHQDEEPLSQPDSNFFEEALAILMRYEEQVEMQGQDEEMQGQDSSITVEEKPIQPIEDCSNIDTVKVIVEELQDQPEDSLKATSVDAYTSNKEDTNRVAHGLDKVEEVSMDLNEFVKSKHEEWVAIHEPSVEDSYEEELKPSPTHFNFAFIREAETPNIIFSAALSEVHKCNLFKVFWGPKETFRWKFHRWRWKDKKSHE